MTIESFRSRRKKIKKKNTQFFSMIFLKFMVLFIHMNDQYTLSPVSTLALKPSFHTDPQAHFHTGLQA